MKLAEQRRSGFIFNFANARKNQLGIGVSRGLFDDLWDYICDINTFLGLRHTLCDIMGEKHDRGKT